MNRRAIPLKSRVRYEGRAQIFDRRATIGADLEKLPDPIWRTIGLVLRSKLTEVTRTQAARKKATEPLKAKSLPNSAASDK